MMRKKTVTRRLHKYDFFVSGMTLLLTAFLVAISLALVPLASAGGVLLSPERKHAIQCIRIVSALERYHYLGKKIDDSLSEQIFDRFVKYLDPSRNLFILKDMEQLEKYRHRFDTDLKRGNLNIAYEIYNLYHDRAVQRLSYILKLIKIQDPPLPLDSPDFLEMDNTQRPWQLTLDDLRALWKKELINHLITLTLDEHTQTDVSETLEKIYITRLTRLSQTTTDDVFQLFMNCVTESFDPHTQYFPPRVSEDFDIQMRLSLEGIGAVLQTEYEYTKIVSLVPKGPADKSSLLMPGDRIIGVGQGKTGEIKDIIGGAHR